MDKYPKKTIGELCRIEKGITGLASAEPGQYPLVATSLERKSCNTYQFDTPAVCIPLVSSTGHGKKTLNYVHYQEGKFALGTILAAVIPKDAGILSAGFLHRYLQFFKETKLVSLMKGAANVSLAVKDIAKIEIPVPPIEEQVQFIELFNKANSFGIQLVGEFNTQSNYLKQLRQSILQEAIEGKLTADWRKTHPVVKGNPDFDAEALLEAVKSKKAISKKDKSLPIVTESEKTFELPDGWIWCRIGDLTNITGGKRLPKGTTFSDEITEFIYIRIVDMKDGTIVDKNLKYISAKTRNQIKNYIITKNDLYITIAGTIGQSGLVPDQFDGMNLTENAARVVPYEVNKQWLNNFISSKTIQELFAKATYGMAMPKLALMRIQNTIIPLPPLAEQIAIVDRIHSLLAKVNLLEKQVNERKVMADELMQSVLREAFG
ncbi:MAG: hypothetical protein CVV49_06200 [Spirochaetae bacterium HGW-Spirochaetae-5]|nr:MAG: hypothetical protein CVV49_06200 [Spirochaetae bacterium HGW-Spirochaetae-5]